MWLYVAVTAYFINAGIYIADKFLLSKKIHSSIAYAFYVGVWSVFSLVLLLFDPWLPNFRQLILDLIVGFLYLVTLVFWYKALHQSEATRVVPIVGALVPVFSFILSLVFLGETLSERQLLAFCILIIGGILISIKHTKFYEISRVKEKFKNVFGNFLGGIHAGYRPSQRLIINSTVSALFFAIFYVLIKYVYSHQPFIGGFVWSRLGSFLGAFLIFSVPAWNKLIRKSRKETLGFKNLFFFLSVRIFGTLAFIFLNWAISLGNVALINSLQGTQYVFLFFLVLFLSARHPKVLKEELGGGVLLQKVLGILLISIGLYMLAVKIV